MFVCEQDASKALMHGNDDVVGVFDGYFATRDAQALVHGLNALSF